MEPRVVQADNAGLFTLSGTRTHLVGRERVVVLDPGPADPLHLERLCRELEGASHVTILVTHGHADHSAGALPLARALEGGASRSGGCPVMGAAPGIPETLSDQERRPDRPGDPPGPLDPGHARPHFAFLWEEPNLLFPGDLLLGEGIPPGSAPIRGAWPTTWPPWNDWRPSPPPGSSPPTALPWTTRQGRSWRFRQHRLHRLEQVAAGPGPGSGHGGGSHRGPHLWSLPSPRPSGAQRGGASSPCWTTWVPVPFLRELPGRGMNPWERGSRTEALSPTATLA
jgi:hypothetical protein